VTFASLDLYKPSQQKSLKHVVEIDVEKAEENNLAMCCRGLSRVGDGGVKGLSGSMSNECTCDGYAR
jgi:hypothetical protein